MFFVENFLKKLLEFSIFVCADTTIIVSGLMWSFILSYTFITLL